MKDETKALCFISGIGLSICVLLGYIAFIALSPKHSTQQKLQHSEHSYATDDSPTSYLKDIDNAHK